MSGSVSVADDEAVTGSGLSLETFNIIKATEEAAYPLPSLTPPATWSKGLVAWQAEIAPMRLRMLRGWARQASAHATAQIGRWHRVEHKVFSAAATSYTFGNLDGNTHKLYKLTWMLKRGGAASDVRLRPNGDSGNASYTAVWSDGSPPDTITQAYLELQYMGASDVYHAGSAIMQAHVTGGSRLVWGTSALANVGADPRVAHWAGQWENTTSNVTSLVLWSPVTNTIGAGSIVWLDRMVQP